MKIVDADENPDKLEIKFTLLLKADTDKNKIFKRTQDLVWAGIPECHHQYAEVIETRKDGVC